MKARNTDHPEPERKHRTLLDVYAERDFDLSDAQVRRIIALLGLTQPRAKGTSEETAA